MNQHLSHVRMISGLIFLLSFQASFAQISRSKSDQRRSEIEAIPQVKTVDFNSKRQTPSLVLLKENSSVTKAGAEGLLTSILKLRAGIDKMTSTRHLDPADNMEVGEYQQYFKGVKVEHAKYRTLIQNGKVRFFNGSFYDIAPTLTVTPVLSEAAALAKAKLTVGAKRYAWEELQNLINNQPNPARKAALQVELQAYLPKGELVLVENFAYSTSAEIRLAYKFNIYASEPLSRAWIYIDATDGKTLLVDKIIKHVAEGNNPPASTNATVQTRYAGLQLIKTKQISGNDPNSGLPLVSSHPLTEPAFLPGGLTYGLLDDTRGKGIETYDLNGLGGLPISLAPFYTQGKSFTDLDNNWTFAEHHRSPANDGALEAENDDIAFDAHWGAEVVYDYWLAKHNRLSYDGNDAKITSFIHYGPAYDNAFWNGSVMTYGDGSGTAAMGFKALTSLDVCGHEIGHGVCSSTSDLIYQGESGAMNEALSDIWASCIENFSMVRAGSTVPSTAYRPFYIGEQIGANFNTPLRRMDNPKAIGDPDTYGGTNWKNPVCTPNTVNDECGVHTNSGVLNHWFFLITAGSKTGTRPAGMTPDQYYFADSDDEINDLGNTYQVNGLGFDISEKITFLMETLLSSSATYAEARAVSIQAATAMSGNPCSALVETITNGWYAVGVGSKFVKPCTIKYGFVYQPGGAVSEASTPSGCVSEKTVFIPVLLPPNSTATITATGTATANVDYVIGTATISNTTSSTASKNVNIIIKNDAVIESDETIILKAVVSNTAGNPVNTAYTLTITDDDVVPVISNADKILLNETFTRADGFADPAGWTEILELAEGSGDPTSTGKNQWGVFDNQLAITGKEGATNTVFPNRTYNSNSASQTVIRSSLIDARGLSLLNLKFDYTVQGEVDPGGVTTDPENLPALDYLVVVYSLDGTHFVELNSGDFHKFASAAPASNTFSANLPASLANKQFYIGFRWSNDTNAGGPVSADVDNLTVKGSSIQIENDLNHNGRENVRNGQEVYFYSVQDRQILGRLQNASGKDYGCTNVFIEKTGSGAFNLYQGKNGLQKVSEKIVRIEPATIVKGANTVTLYYTEAQLTGLEQASGFSRTAFGIYHINAAAYTLAGAQNTTKIAATYSNIAGVGGFYSFSFNDQQIGSYALGVTVSAPLVQSATFSSISADNNVRLQNTNFGNLFPNPGSKTVYLPVSSSTEDKYTVEFLNTTGQVLLSQTTRIPAGKTNIMVNTSRLSVGSYRIRVTNQKGQQVNTQQYLRN